MCLINAGTILCFAIYLSELVVFRKKWYKNGMDE